MIMYLLNIQTNDSHIVKRRYDSVTIRAFNKHRLKSTSDYIVSDTRKLYNFISIAHSFILTSHIHSIGRRALHQRLFALSALMQWLGAIYTNVEGITLLIYEHLCRHGSLTGRAIAMHIYSYAFCVLICLSCAMSNSLLEDVPAGTAYLPTRRSKYTVLRSPHIYKKSREQFERCTHGRVYSYDIVAAQYIYFVMSRSYESLPCNNTITCGYVDYEYV